MYEALHPTSDIERLNFKQKHGGGGLISIEKCVRLEEENLGLYLRGSSKMALKSVRKDDIVKTENLVEIQDFKKNRQNDEKDGTKREYMDSFFMKCQKK